MSAIRECENETENQLLQFVTFWLGGEEYAVDILSTQEINKVNDITKIPDMPDYVEGVINLRGKIIPVINLRKKFGIKNKEIDQETRIMVVDVKNMVLGLMVDGVSEVLRISSDTIEPAPKLTTKVSSNYVRGIGKIGGKMVILLDLEELLPENELASLTG